ncbi:MAG: glycosyltransferase family 39 protein [Synechococcales cyanobacterium K44_A2020_017]|nr:glycosyltransferase family 39 protein [Synechococcales cyanobacterium K32_A2020_035]MBF2096060.1 glycosyltransferase family 39 protein [Synechococcales cyanobacterium K44_A2020_017]
MKLEAPLGQWLRWGAIALLVIGILFRFGNLGRKVYWIDETYTSLRISGYGEQELIAQTYTGEVITVADLQSFQKLSPDRTWTDTLQSLSESPQHPPLYFLLGRLWIQIWGASPATVRSLSALLSLLTFPALYWLGRELFERPTARWLAIVCVAVSPFHVLYAQEARQYSLWTALTIASGAALLWAIRLTQTAVPPPKRWLAWLTYTLLLATSFYTFLLTGLVAIAHGVFIGIRTWQKRERSLLLSYLVATAAAILLFAPWLWVMINHAQRVSSTAAWANERFSLDWLILRWLLYPINQFLDLNLGDRYLTSPAILLMVAMVALIIYAVIVVAREAPPLTAQFIFVTTAVPALMLILPDLLFGGQRSGTARYMIPVYFGLHLAVIYALSLRLETATRTRARWQLITLGVLVAGIVSCGISSQATLWWTKSPDKHQHNHRIVAALNQSDRPLLISDDSTDLSTCFACRMLTLSYDLPPETRLQLVRSPQIPVLPSDRPDVFVLSPSRRLVRRLEDQGYTSRLVFEADRVWFWHLTPDIKSG